MNKALLIFLLSLHSISSFGRNGIEQLNLMPMPREIELLPGKFDIKNSLTVTIEGNGHSRLNTAIQRFLQRLDNRTGTFFNNAQVTSKRSQANLIVKVKRPGVLDLHEDESYSLNIENDLIYLVSENDIGAIRGLQTLLQLLKNDQDGFYFPNINVVDSPRFKWRGLMIDVSRHFQPVHVIYRNLDGMEAVKMNVLHLHLSDDHGFRVESKVYPNLHENSSDGDYYTHQQIKSIISYAEDRGIRVVPEIDVPGHASSILTAYPHIGSKDTIYSLARNAGVFDPTLDPSNPETYEFLKNLFSEVAALFPDEYFHIGGDENEGVHWDENQGIQEFMRKNKMDDNHDLHTYFNEKINGILKSLNKKMIGWEEIQTPNLSKDAVIHAWRGKNEGFELRGSLNHAVKNGHYAILSDGYYIDRMNSAASHYVIDPLPENNDLTSSEKDRILGGEVTMWSELVTPLTIDSRIWPRTAAIAERFWSSSKVNNIESMHTRLEKVNLLLETYGLTHIRNKETILRNLVKGQDVEPLRTLVDVIEPLKGYTRNPGGKMYSTYSPFTMVADAASADAPDAYKFNRAVQKYIDGNSEDTYNEVVKFLNSWKSNNVKLQPIIMQSPALLSIEKMSKNLSEIARIGLESLEYISNDKTPNDSWYNNALESLNQARIQSARTELQIINPIEKLVQHSRKSHKLE